MEKNTTCNSVVTDRRGRYSCFALTGFKAHTPPMLSCTPVTGNSPRWTTWGRGRPLRRAKLLQRPLLRTEDKKDSDSVDVFGGSFPAYIITGSGGILY